MKKVFLALLVLFLLTQSSNAFFFNLGGFLKPILNPSGNYAGEKIPDSNTKTISIFGIINFTFKTNNLRREVDTSAKDLYEAIGIPENLIYSKVLPVHTEVSNKLNRYFGEKFHLITKYSLYLTVKKLKDLIDWMTKNYLEDVNTLILGDNNFVYGENIYMKGSNHTVIA